MPIPPQFRSNDELLAHLQLGETHESLHLEFKRDKLSSISRMPKSKERDKQKAELARETARDIVQFANARGGTILYGVDEAKDNTMWKVAAGVSGVGDPEGLMSFLAESVRRLVQPAGLTYQWRPLTCTSGESVVAVTVPALASGIASVWGVSERQIEFCRRTDHGKVYMSPADVEAHLMDTSRQTYLLALELLEQVRLDRGAPNAVLASGLRDEKQMLERANCVVSALSGGGNLADPAGYYAPLVARRECTHFQQNITIVDVTPTEVKLQVHGRSTEAPLSRVSDIWMRSDGRIGLTLSGVVVKPESDAAFVFFEPV